MTRSRPLAAGKAKMRPASLQGVGGEPPAVTTPLEQAQIDHTAIDLIVVDERDR